MSEDKQFDDDVMRRSMEKVAQLKVYQLNLMVQIIDTAMSRGAFRGKEASHVGILYDNLVDGIKRAYEITAEEIEKENEKLPTINEDEIAPTD